MPSTYFQIIFQIILPAVLAVTGVALRALTWRGGIAAMVVGIVVAYCTPALFPALVAMVVVGVVSTKIRLHADVRRHNLKTCSPATANGIERQDDRVVRGAGSVIGNGGATALFAIVYYVFREYNLQPGLSEPSLLMDMLHYATAGSVAAAAADTVAGEIGRALRARAFSILTFKPVEIGSNGGVSVFGTVAGAVASAMIGTISGLFSAYILFGSVAKFDLPFAAIVTVAGIFGCFIDSIIGATVEGKTFGFAPGINGLFKIAIGNNETNFIGTFMGGLVATIMRFFV